MAELVRWSAWHLHVPQSRVDEVLAVLWPRVRPLVVAGGVPFFYLRYWQSGPHLRLRFQTDDVGVEWLEKVLGSVSLALTEEDLQEYDSQVAAQGMLARLEGEDPLPAHPMGMLRREPYFPELAKYGGERGVALAERVFCRSSVLVCESISATAGRPRRFDALGAGLQLTTQALAGSGLTMAQSVDFLYRYGDFWSAYGSFLSPAGLARARAATRDVLLPMVAETWRSDATLGLLPEFQSCAIEFANAAGSARGDLGAHLGGAPYGRWLSNLIHTTNNRLGLRPDQETVVAALLAETLSEYGHIDSLGSPSGRRLVQESQQTDDVLGG